MSKPPSSKPLTRPPANPQRLAFLRQASAPLLEQRKPRLLHRWLHSNESGKTWEAFGLRDSAALDRALAAMEREEGLTEAATEDIKEEPEAEAKAEKKAGEADGDAAAAKQEDDAAQAKRKEVKGEADKEQPAAKKAKHEDKAHEADELEPPNPDVPLPSWRVPVAQDHLFEVDMRHRKLHPVFAKGKTCDVLKGTWFFDASKLSPCTNAVAEELEKLYTNIKPWLPSYADELRSSVAIGADGEAKLKCDLETLPGSYVIFLGPHLARIYTQNVGSRITKTFLTIISGEHGGGTLVARGFDNARRLLRTRKGEKVREPSSASKKPQDGTSTPTRAAARTRPEGSPTTRIRKSLESVRSVDSGAATSDAEHGPEAAAVAEGSAKPATSGDSLPGKAEGAEEVPGTGAETPSKGGMAGAKAAAEPFFKTLSSKLGSWSKQANASVGFSALSARNQRDVVREAFDEASAKAQDLPPPASAVDTSAASKEEEDEEDTAARTEMESAGLEKNEDAADETADEHNETEEDAQREEEEELKKEEEEESKPLELLLVIHGIGQGLSQHWRSLDFTLAVAQLRQQLHSRAKGHFPALLEGRRVQCLPILWRATMDDLEDGHDHGEEDIDQGLDNRFTLNDALGRDAIPLVKQIFSGALSDVPLYMGPRHLYLKRKLVEETNRVWRLWLQRNPNFTQRGGKVHIVSHSLGSCLTLDVLSEQPTKCPPLESFERWDKHWAFDVGNVWMLGSPAALFVWMNRKQLIARKGRELSEGIEDDACFPSERYGCMALDRLWNVYAASDPIGTRLNPCVDGEYSAKLSSKTLTETTAAILNTLPGVDIPASTTSGPAALFGAWKRSGAPAAGNSTIKASGEGSKGGDASAQAEGDDETPDGAGDELLASSPSAEKKLAGGVEKDGKSSYAERRREKELKKGGGKDGKEGETEADDEYEKVEEEGKKNEAEEAEEQPPASTSKADDPEARRMARAARRFAALNPLGVGLDFVIPPSASILNHQYMELLYAHSSYWGDKTVADFLLATLFASRERLERAGRRMRGEESEGGEK